MWVSVGIIVLDFIIRIVALGVVPHNRRPAAAWGWLLAIFFIPLIGIFFYLLLGGSSLPKDRAKKQVETATRLKRADPEHAVVGKPPGMPEWAAEGVRLNHDSGGMPLTGGNDLEIHTDYDASMAAMEEKIRQASVYVHFQFYIVAEDRTTKGVVNALVEAHRRGVAVRVLIDHLGSVGFPGYSEMVDRLNEAGIAWHRMLPVRPWRGEYQRPDIRNHRKMLIVDGKTAFTGSQNVIDRSYNKRKNRREHLKWKDIMVRVEGPAVQQLNAVFLTDWISEADQLPPLETPYPASDGEGSFWCQILPSGPGFDNQSNLRLFNHLFYGAERRISIVSPYFVPDESMFYALTTAVQRGVEVTLHVGEISDHALTHHAQRSYYETMLQSGIKIMLYREPYVLHSKFLLVDDAVSVIASSNMDIRSFTLNLEVNLMVLGREFMARMDRVLDDYDAGSHPLRLEEWLKRPLLQKYFDNVCRLTSGLQ